MDIFLKKIIVVADYFFLGVSKLLFLVVGLFCRSISSFVFLMRSLLLKANNYLLCRPQGVDPEFLNEIRFNTLNQKTGEIT